MYCNKCKYEDIHHIMLYDYVLDKCDKCDTCSMILSDYFPFIKTFMVHKKFLNINMFTSMEDLNKINREKYFDAINKFSINFNALKKIEYKCRACGENLYELKKTKDFSIFMCKECLRVYFNEELFKKYSINVLNSYNKFYYFKYMYKRFLRFLRSRSKNNVKK